MHFNWFLVSCLLVLLSVGLTTRTVDANKKSKEESEEEESQSTDTDSNDDDSDDDNKAGKKAVFIPRERASIFLSYNECMRRMNCGVARREECSEECAGGNTEEELEEYAEVFENLEEYRQDAKKNRPKRKNELSGTDETDSDSDSDSDKDSDSDSDDDNDETDPDTDSDNETETDNDEEDEEEKESDSRSKSSKKKSKSSNKNPKRTSDKSKRQN